MKKQPLQSQTHEVKILKIIPPEHLVTIHFPFQTFPKVGPFEILQHTGTEQIAKNLVQDDILDDFSFGLNTDKQPLYERIKQVKRHYERHTCPEKLNFITSPTWNYELMDFGWSEYIPSDDTFQCF